MAWEPLPALLIFHFGLGREGNFLEEGENMQINSGSEGREQRGVVVVGWMLGCFSLLLAVSSPYARGWLDGSLLLPLPLVTPRGDDL